MPATTRLMPTALVAPMLAGHGHCPGESQRVQASGPHAAHGRPSGIADRSTRRGRGSTPHARHVWRWHLLAPLPEGAALAVLLLVATAVLSVVGATRGDIGIGRAEPIKTGCIWNALHGEYLLLLA